MRTPAVIPAQAGILATAKCPTLLNVPTARSTRVGAPPRSSLLAKAERRAAAIAPSRRLTACALSRTAGSRQGPASRSIGSPRGASRLPLFLHPIADTQAHLFAVAIEKAALNEALRLPCLHAEGVRPKQEAPPMALPAVEPAHYFRNETGEIVYSDAVR